MPLSRSHLAITGPTRDSVPASFAVDLAQIYAYTRARGPWAHVTVGFVAATYIHVGREWVCEQALAAGASDILWLDTDMSFPPESAIRLAHHDRAIVGCNYRTRDGSGQFTARRGDDRVETGPNSTGLESVEALGFGVLLMQTAVLRDVPRPWFRHGVNPSGGDIGEDLMCCRALRAAGHAIWLDHELSHEIGHVGLHTWHTDRPVTVAV